MHVRIWEFNGSEEDMERATSLMRQLEPSFRNVPGLLDLAVLKSEEGARVMVTRYSTRKAAEAALDGLWEIIGTLKESGLVVNPQSVQGYDATLVIDTKAEASP